MKSYVKYLTEQIMLNEAKDLNINADNYVEDFLSFNDLVKLGLVRPEEENEVPLPDIVITYEYSKPFKGSAHEPPSGGLDIVDVVIDNIDLMNGNVADKLDKDAYEVEQWAIDQVENQRRL